MNSCSRRDDAESSFGVYILDLSADQGKFVEAICLGSGHPLELSSAPEDSRCWLGLVGLDPIFNLREQCAKILELKGLGGTIIAYQPGARSLPLAARCDLLLAGCTEVLDSSLPGFPVQLRTALDRFCRTETARRSVQERVSRTMSECGAVASSDAMLEIFRSVERVSAFSELPVLITGETGTGKELIAQAIYQQDTVRRGKPFVPVNCGALDPELAGSELFGHRKGAFTGAVQSRAGLFRAAHQGILFLDEVGELTPALQARLLRVLQTGKLLAVGDDHEVAVDVRVLSATNRDLRSMVSDGTFREDLYHRLNVTAIHIPPLRERPEDIAPLVSHFLARYGGAGEEAGPDFIYALTRSRLPGNARQVENLVRHGLVYREPGHAITLRDLPPEVLDGLLADTVIPRIPAKAETGVGPDVTTVLEQNGWSLSRSLETLERMMIEAALNAAGGNQTKAASNLGITPRSIYNKLHRRS